LSALAREFDLDKTGRAAAPEAETLRDPLPDHPRDAPTDEQQRDPGPLLAGHFGVYEIILEFFLARHPERPEPIPGAPAPEREPPF
jgi:hypothetical protein